MHTLKGLLAATAMAALLGCGKDGSTALAPESNQVGTGRLTATINGSAWSALWASSDYTGNAVFVLAANVNRAIGFLVPDVRAPGTYPLRSVDGFVATAEVVDGESEFSTSMPGGSGTITFTRVSGTRVTGTFAFVAPNRAAGASPAAVTVTNGSFDISTP